MSSIEQQFQARIAQAKEAARLASLAAAARNPSVSSGPRFASTAADSGVLSNPAPNVPFTSTIPTRNVPPHVKNRIDRLVEFVTRNGDAFEATTRQREGNNPDFAFLRPNGPYSDYYQWKKQQVCEGPPPAAAFAFSPPPRAPCGSPDATALTASRANDLLGDMSVGAMANVCKFARASGVQTYAPIPREIIMNVGNLPPVEPARLEIRLSEFYRHEERTSRRD